MREVKSNTNFFINKEVKFNNSERRVVIAGHVHQNEESTDQYDVHLRKTGQKSQEYHLDIGYAIFNPTDEYNKQLGEKIALGRAIKRNNRTISITSNQPFSSKKQILSLMKSALIQLQDNVKEFAPFAMRRRRRRTEEVKTEEVKK